jgi:DNA (cytosine-5)-methyltransferase 1
MAAFNGYTLITHTEILKLIDQHRKYADLTGKPLLLDLFCCGGGASMGYKRAGFIVIGVDIEQRNNYPFAFVRFDAIEFVKVYGHLFDAVVGSPPCQSSSALTKGTNKANGWGKGTDESAGGWIDLIPATRAEFARLGAMGIPTVIENVAGAHIRKDLTLCGTMFGLEVFRHRFFEISGFDCPQKPHERPGGGRQHFGSLKGWNHGKSNPTGEYYQVYGNGGQKGSIAEWQRAMGIDWLSERNELAEAIPPAYSEYIGGHLLAEIKAKRDEAQHDMPDASWTAPF